ncbi:kinase-like protein [Calocera viscosa TUFC12733]|uniref:Kinase-like protein n=1 Tax=Calocera viscosa (strain TUFC12733) TaxID=1330018 RepID=A0A167J6W1_CALVF|nr:kinase-like protein [Calocera viscosa TUFC12733]
MDTSPAPIPPRRARPAGGRPLLHGPRLNLAIPARDPSPAPSARQSSLDQTITPTPVRHPSVSPPTIVPTPPSNRATPVPLLNIPRPPHSRSATPHIKLDLGALGSGSSNGTFNSRPASPTSEDETSMYNHVSYNTPTLRPPMTAGSSAASTTTTLSALSGSSSVSSLADAIKEWTIHPTDSDSDSENSSADPNGKVYCDKDFVVIERLGEGAGGSVDKVKEIATGLIWARKTIPAPSAPIQQLRRELNFLANCKHPHIVVFHGTYLSAGDSLINVLMEYCEGGSLEAVRDRMREERAAVSEKVIAKIAEGCLKGLEYLKSKNIIHRDIKPSNILLTAAGIPKLIDFGVSGELVDSYAGTFTGTSYYMAPERIQGAKYSVRSDVWSLGLTLMELARTEPIYPVDLGPIELITYIVGSQPPTLDDAAGDWSDEMKDFFRQCLCLDDSKRPSPTELLQHPWILESQKRKINLARWIQQVWQWDKPSSRPQSALQ